MSVNEEAIAKVQHGIGCSQIIHRAARQDDVAPRIWVLIDEAHLVCPGGVVTAARPVIVDFVKRGRDAGLSLIMATQQPSALDTAAISQNDLVLIHKLTIDPDIARAPASCRHS